MVGAFEYLHVSAYGFCSYGCRRIYTFSVCMYVSISVYVCMYVGVDI